MQENKPQPAVSLILTAVILIALVKGLPLVLPGVLIYWGWRLTQKHNPKPKVVKVKKDPWYM